MPNFSGIWTITQQMQAKGASTWPATPGAPTIGTATAGGANCAAITFTAPSCAGYPATITGYRVVSTPGCFTQTGASSPLTVTGLTTGTSYTFKAQATNANGYGDLSAASNSITAAVTTCATYTTPGTYSWVAPAGVTSVAVLVVSPGAGRKGGSLAYKNAYSVTPGSAYTVFLRTTTGGENVYSYFVSSGVVGATNNAFTGDGGGIGGAGVRGGGGAGGYSGNGGAGSTNSGSGANGCAGSGGGGGGGASQYWPAGDAYVAGAGGGVGIYGQGSNGAGGTFTPASSYISLGGGGGSGGTTGGCSRPSSGSGPVGGTYGGGGGCGNYNGIPANGAIRIVWAGGSRGTPSFPSTNVGA